MVDTFVRDYLIERIESMLEHRIITGYYRGLRSRRGNALLPRAVTCATLLSRPARSSWPTAIGLCPDCESSTARYASRQPLMTEFTLNVAAWAWSRNCRTPCRRAVDRDSASSDPCRPARYLLSCRVAGCVIVLSITALRPGAGRGEHAFVRGRVAGCAEPGWLARLTAGVTRLLLG